MGFMWVSELYENDAVIIKWISLCCKRDTTDIMISSNEMIVICNVKPEV